MKVKLKILFQLASDFDKRFPSSKDNLINNWKKIAPYVVNVAISRKITSKENFLYSNGIYLLLLKLKINFIM